MRIVIAGGHGKIALRLAALLSARGDEVVGLIRDPAQAGDVSAAGATPVVRDVAAVLVTLLDTPPTAGLTLELMGGDTPIDEAVAALLGA